LRQGKGIRKRAREAAKGREWGRRERLASIEKRKVGAYACSSGLDFSK